MTGQAAEPPPVDEVLFDQGSIASRVAEIGRRITEDYADRDLVLVTVLRGGVFFLADLCRHIELPLLIKYSIPTEGVRPYLIAGPSLGLLRTRSRPTACSSTA